MMTNAQLATASLDDIVFDGRNRQYGAYQLRAHYQRHMTRALIIGSVMLALLLVFPLVAQLLKEDVLVVPTDLDKGKVTLIAPPLAPERVITPPPTTAPPKSVLPAAPAQHLAATRFVEMKVTPDDQATEDVPDQKLLANTTVSTITSIGEASATDLGPLTDTGGTKEIGADVVKETTYVYVEQMPELPGGGGQKAIVAAIQKAAKYPALALGNQIEGKIYVSFIVNSLGDVSDVKVVKGLGYGLDEETIRAVKTLPRFTPGKQNGRAVSVAYTVPISFKIQ
ncbi:energy transducer TonB [Hymenobacter siberiensis]|jgi:protein TonB|uniref:energy transducer TonB n=1 Tax=Hymenobacter siberiensis TaxID=2848396 RepID=UPI001C1E6413|nr:energy transducer TonB [Hymenobacter siberiensis]MBU6120085.1 energy transducer TonB [Hymenobacter siberiensis]